VKGRLAAFAAALAGSAVLGVTAGLIWATVAPRALLQEVGRGEAQLVNPESAAYILADACNLFDIQGSQFRDNLTRKLGVLREHCAQVGRDYAEIEKTVATSFDLGEDPKAGAVALLAHLRELAEAGISHALVAPEGPWDEARFDAVAAILPDIHAIEPERG